MSEKIMPHLVKNFVFFLITLLTVFTFNINTVFAKGSESADFIKKVSKDYTKKYCNSIGFGLSKESAMKFSKGENEKVFEKKKLMKTINQELLAEEIASSVIENCGYSINLFGEEGIQEFKDYYLSKDK